MVEVEISCKCDSNSLITQRNQPSNDLGFAEILFFRPLSTFHRYRLAIELSAQ